MLKLPKVHGHCVVKWHPSFTIGYSYTSFVFCFYSYWKFCKFHWSVSELKLELGAVGCLCSNIIWMKLPSVGLGQNDLVGCNFPLH
jgi:hypothetical protein